jgi:hypothetical protein
MSRDRDQSRNRDRSRSPHPHPLPSLAIALLGATAALGACDAASPELGTDAWLQLPEAQWRPGALPDDEGGPAVLGVQTVRATIQLGNVRERLRGQLAAPTRALALGLAGDRGAWILPADPPASENPEVPSFDVRAQIARALPAGPVELLVVAFDEQGRAGPVHRTELVAVAQEPPAGQLVFELTWDGPADLDLHVVDPLGGEAWSGDPNTWQAPPPGTPFPPDAWKSGGILTRDGNARCRRDGAPSEHVVWQQPPPPGRYVVRVDASAMCGAVSASWRVAAYRSDTRELVAAARGTSLADDALAPHGRGAGVLALEVTLPIAIAPTAPASAP